MRRMHPVRVARLVCFACVVATVATGCAEQEADGLEAQYPVGSTPPRDGTSAEAIDSLTPPPGDAPPLPSEQAPPPSAAPAGGPPSADGPEPPQGASVVIGDDPPAQGDEQANGAADDGAPPVDQVPPSMQGAPADAPPDTDPSALNAFRGALDPYGSWVDDPTYGTVWVPSPGAVGPDFTPYETAGHWAYDDSSYVWESDYSWGWAPFHYGRWVYSRPVGWGWIPGRTYSGAWVSWRSGFDDWAYVGWAPLSPTWGWRHGAAVGLGFVPTAPYAFVSTRDLFAPRIASHLVMGAREATVAAHTRPYVAGPAMTAGGRTIAHPTVGGPSPSTLGIPQSAVVRTPSYQAAARARSGGAVFGQRGLAGATVGAGQGPMQGRSLAPAYGPPVGSHFGGRFGTGFAGPGVTVGPTRAPSSAARAYDGPARAYGGTGRSYTLGRGGVSTGSPYYRGGGVSVGPRYGGGAPAGGAYFGSRSLSTGVAPGGFQGGAVQGPRSSGGPVGAPPAAGGFEGASRGGGVPSGGSMGGGFHGGGGSRGGGGRSSGGGRGGHR
jgi:hypothetical protein